MEYIDKQRKDYLSWDEFFMGSSYFGSQKAARILIHKLGPV